jgi:anti-sigma-K factor RskA
MKNYDDNRIRLLVDKYFEGETSLKEEKTVRDYFAREDIAPDMTHLQPLFLYFNRERAEAVNDERQKTDGNRTDGNAGRSSDKSAHKSAHKSAGNTVMMWISLAAAAAACALLIVGQNPTDKQSLTGTKNTSMAYIDGKQCTDLNLVCTDALNALDDLTDTDDGSIAAQIQAINELTN